MTDRKDELVRFLDLKKARVNQDELKCCCPNPTHPDNDPSFSINLTTGYSHCFSCGFSTHNFLQLFMKLNVPAPDWAKDETIADKGYIRREARRKRMAETKTKTKTVIEPRNSWLEFLSKNGDMAGDYMQSRGVSQAITDMFKIGYNPDKDILFFPAIDINGDLQGWAERSDKYSNRWKIMPEGVEKSNMLFGEHLLNIGEKNNLYLVEGMVDCMKLWEYGLKAVATFGSVVLDKQAEKIVDLAEHVILIPDNDKGGLKFRFSAVKQLKGKVPLSGCNLPPDINDVGSMECTGEALKEAIKNRITIR